MAKRDEIVELDPHSAEKYICDNLLANWGRRLLSIAAIALVPVIVTPDLANARGAPASQQYSANFTQAKFNRAQDEGRLILVETFADWCAPCQIQAPIVQRLQKEKRYDNLVLLRIGEDTPRHVWKDLKLAGYGQFVVFQGSKEVGRGSPLNEAAMRALLSR